MIDIFEIGGAAFFMGFGLVLGGYTAVGVVKVCDCISDAVQSASRWACKQWGKS